ncbi:MAG: hypothetical protein U1F43_29615 [Myxococcota bacterium]
MPAWLSTRDFTVEVYRRDPGEWTQVLAVEGAQKVRLPPFEVIELDLADWWDVA